MGVGATLVVARGRPRGAPLRNQRRANRGGLSRTVRRLATAGSRCGVGTKRPSERKVRAPPVAHPAVPSASGADLLVLDGNGLRALTSDGSTSWVNPNVGSGGSSQLIPDFAGSASVTQFYSYADAQGLHSTHRLQGIDPTTHQLTTLYTFADGWEFGASCSVGGVPVPNCFQDTGATQTVIPHPSGTIFVLDAPPTSVYGCMIPGVGNYD